MKLAAEYTVEMVDNGKLKNFRESAIAATRKGGRTVETSIEGGQEAPVQASAACSGVEEHPYEDLHGDILCVASRRHRQEAH